MNGGVAVGKVNAGKFIVAVVLETGRTEEARINRRGWIATAAHSNVRLVYMVVSAIVSKGTQRLRAMHYRLMSRRWRDRNRRPRVS